MAATILIVEDERIAFVNPAAVGLFGANGPDQLLGRSLLDFFHAENHGSVREHFRHWRAGRTALPLEARIVPPDGKVRDISVTGFDDLRSARLSSPPLTSVSQERADRFHQPSVVQPSLSL